MFAVREDEKPRADREARFLWAQENGFVLVGRINSAAGTTLAATLINCFVQPIGGSVVEIVDGKPGIYSALAELLSMDMRANDHGWLALKLESLAKTPGDEGFEMPFPPHGERQRMPSVVSAMAKLIQYRVERLDSFKHEGPTPVLDAMFSRKEPKTGTDGTLSWTVDVFNPATGEDFVVGLKEITLPDGVTRPYSIWLSGNYPRALDGLTKLLSFDMRVLDPAWIGMKLRKLLDYPEPLGDFMAFIPGTRRQTNYPSTVAYLAQLIIHRYAMLGILRRPAAPRRNRRLESCAPSAGI